MGNRQPPLTPVQVRALINKLLDRQYIQAVAPVLRAMLNGTASGLIAQRLSELDAEVVRLAAAGQKLTLTNAVLRALLADLEDVLRAHAALMDGTAAVLQASGAQAAGQAVQQLALPGAVQSVMQVLGVAWNVPDPDALAALVNYTSSAAWREMLKAYPADVLKRIQAIILRGVLMGQGPAQTARELRAAITGMSARLASTIMRTLQLTSYRDAAVLHRLANADIIDYQVRIAALDARCCLACVALHGTILPIDARVDDHWNGRCDSISVVKGRPNPVTMTGEQWFRRRTEAQQREQMGHANYEAWQAGALQLADFVQHTTSDTFGPMVQQASLSGILGEAAKQYYARNR